MSFIKHGTRRSTTVDTLFKTIYPYIILITVYAYDIVQSKQSPNQITTRNALSQRELRLWRTRIERDRDFAVFKIIQTAICPSVILL